MKSSILTILFLCNFYFLNSMSLASEAFAPVTSENWECLSDNSFENKLNINIDYINYISSGILNGVTLNNSSNNLHSLSGNLNEQDYKSYSIRLIPYKTINYFKGCDNLTINGRAIVHYEVNNECIGASQGNIYFECKIQLER